MLVAGHLSEELHADIHHRRKTTLSVLGPVRVEVEITALGGIAGVAGLFHWDRSVYALT
jgi:hypothetical protein